MIMIQYENSLISVVKLIYTHIDDEDPMWESLNINGGLRL